jgi:hypothetical protein
VFEEGSRLTSALSIEEGYWRSDRVTRRTCLSAMPDKYVDTLALCVYAFVQKEVQNAADRRALRTA